MITNLRMELFEALVRLQESLLPHLVGGLPRHVHQAGVHGGGGHHGLGARDVAGSVVDEDQGVVPQKFPSELHPKIRNHGEGPY